MECVYPSVEHKKNMQRNLGGCILLVAQLCIPNMMQQLWQGKKETLHGKLGSVLIWAPNPE